MANSPKYHPLTEEIRSVLVFKDSELRALDTMIRHNQEACAGKLMDRAWTDMYSEFKAIINDVLGLGDVEAKGITDCGDMDHPLGCKCKKPLHVHEKLGYTDYKCDCDNPPKETPKNEWCEHLDRYKMTVFTFEDERWKFCPICGTHRPKSLTKQERLAQYLYQEFLKNFSVDNSSLFDAERSIQAHYMELSGKVINWLKEDK